MKPFPTLQAGETADVALMLEGTYPYVSGGVSSWVHQIIRGLPEISFSIAFLGGMRESYGEPRYELPDNVVHLELHYLMESWHGMFPRARRGNAAAHGRMVELHELLRSPHRGLAPRIIEQALADLGNERGISREDFLYSEQSWRRVCADYMRYCTDPSFVDYFWTVRTMHAPLFMLADVARHFPDARVFHSISTGYAGFLGAMLARRRHRPYILTEHGIYTKERRIDLAHAEWIKEARDPFGGRLDDQGSYIRRLWIRFFEGLGRVAYASADPIIALYEGNRRRQVEDGAAAARTRSIPNGIDLERLAPLREKRAKSIPPILGLIGRVVPIKDIRTFIRAMRTVCAKLPEAEGWIIGPEEEDPTYARECHDLALSLGLSEKVKFLGFQQISDMLPQLGLLMLTSISEALPLVILEGYAAGVPVVATDVGSCRELIEGQTPEDRALGTAGRVVPIASPEATASAALELLTNPPTWQAAQQAGFERVERYYTQVQMYDSYRQIYGEALEASSGRDRLRAS